MTWYDRFLLLKQTGRLPALNVVHDYFTAMVYNPETKRFHYGHHPDPEQALLQAETSEDVSPIVVDPSAPILEFHREGYTDHVRITQGERHYELRLGFPAQAEDVRHAVATLVHRIKSPDSSR